MKRAIAVLLLAGFAAGCAPSYRAPVPPGIDFVDPEAPPPGEGYFWNYNAASGWGWFHPEFGWHGE